MGDKVRIRAKIYDKYTRVAALHAKNGDLIDYSADKNYIYKLISHEEHQAAIISANPLMMSEIGIQAETDPDYYHE